MARARPRLKSIACLESLWDENLEKRKSVVPILDVIVKNHDVRSVYLTCNTEAELEFNLGLLPRKRTYRILYLAFHGSMGEIHLADGTPIALPYLAHLMGGRFRDWIVHFGSCGTIGADDEELGWFVRETGISLVTGYTKNVDWVDSAALDMVLLSSLQRYKDLRAMTKKITRDYASLVDHLGFASYP
jgi:hypothetical protein